MAAAHRTEVEADISETLAGSQSAPHRQWVEACGQAMRPWSAGVEVTRLGDEGAHRVREAYGERNYARLAALKRAYDPDNVFRFNQNIEPAGQPASPRAADEGPNR